MGALRTAGRLRRGRAARSGRLSVALDVLANEAWRTLPRTWISSRLPGGASPRGIAGPFPGRYAAVGSADATANLPGGQRGRIARLQLRRINAPLTAVASPGAAWS